MKLSSFIKLGVTEALCKGGNILISLILAAVFSPEEYSTVVKLILLEIVFIEMYLFGQHHSVLKGFDFTDTFASVTKFSIVNGVALIAVGYYIFNSLLMIFPLVFSILFQAYAKLYATRCRYLGWNDEYNRFRITEQLLRLVSIVSMCYLGGHAQYYSIGALVSGSVVALIIYFKNSGLSNYKFSHLLRLNFRSEHIRFGFPLGIHALAGALYVIVDKILVGSMMSTNDLAVYAFTSTIAMSPFFALNVISLAFTPKIYSCNGGALLSLRLKQFFVISIVSIFIIYILLTLLIYPYILSFYDETYQQGKEFFNYFIIVLVLQALSNTFLYGLAAIKFVKWVPIITISGLTLNCMLGLFLVPNYFTTGVLAAFMMAELFVCIMFGSLFMISQKKIKMSR
ncbi:lipopolysaccharide biosynthesis protein [Vibrio coralliilyticus]|uniref:lipopolysaccharide biosynthesis protein n=1 Tax=Vibrio coralliilyticus TaxID=190893 RepID=UPI0006CC2EEC|nr:oligosaccharide flippase family protein [Vibrio coralliilyticus]ANW24199.1 hypothetical protein BA953_08195 [Vibrio coralliilyticus]AXN32115.1 hypothetical protein DVV14_12925 [Vibrio coralliilyticus]KPH26364.1 hypothetical protein ADU60_14315 [Vibrio coralliilyticus]